MSSSFIQIAVIAAITIFIGWRLYVTLGEDDGPPEGRERGPEPDPQMARPGPDRGAPPIPGNAPPVPQRPLFTGPAASGLEAIYERDEAFDPKAFLDGAKSAYDIIVNAFARGERETLKPLLDTDVYDAWDKAIAERETAGTKGLRLVRLRKAEIQDASLDKDDVARIVVRFDAELADDEITHKAHDLWTFMRDTGSADPNWVLDDVDQAE